MTTSIYVLRSDYETIHESNTFDKDVFLSKIKAFLAVNRGACVSYEKNGEYVSFYENNKKGVPCRVIESTGVLKPLA